jgi:hypothetical protein
MALTSNKLQKQVDLPVWEWTRPLPATPGTTAGVSAFCNADNTDFDERSGRYIYMLLNATNFWRYDTVADTYLQLATPGIPPTAASSMQFAGAQGYYGRVISATSTTITTGLPNSSALGYRIRIISGKGAGQERIITAVSAPVVADWGGVSTAATANITDASKAWTFNNWIGYVVRTTGGTGQNQVRKILYNSATVLAIADLNIYAWDSNAVPLSTTAGTIGITTTAIGTQYQIESSTITVDSAWSVTPDDTSRYVIQSGGVWLASGATVANGGLTLQYYSVLEDVWYAKSINSNMVPAVPSDLSLERFTENSSIWYTGKATSGNTTTLTDANANWTTNQWAGYHCFIWTGTGKAQIAEILSNSGTALTFSTTLGTGLDSTSRYNILGYDAGTLTSATGRILSDTSKTWEVNRWANYAIRIIAGTGDGQMRQIMSNGTDSIITYDPWNIQPDNTSIYAIQSYTNDMLMTVGASAETFLYHAEGSDLVSHGRILDEGTVQAAAALPVDGTSTATHVVYEQKPVTISSISGTTTITATTSHSHQFKVNQWVSIRGITNTTNAYNVTGKVQIASIPSATSFTYTPFAAGTGTYQYSDNVTVGVSVLPDASKYHADLATGGSTTTVTFSRATPTNINGWYAYGTNIAAGAQVQSGAGTTTITFNLTGAGTPTGTIIFSKWPRPVTATYSSGGGAGVFTTTLTGNVPAYCKGWLVTGTNIGLGTYLTGGEGTATINLSIQNSGTPSGTITFSHPTNLPLPVTATYSSGTGTSITLSASVPTYVRGWFVSGTNIGNGTTIVSGEGTATITLSQSTSGTPSGTITFYPPTMIPAMLYATTAAPVVTATTFGLLATGSPMQLVAQNTTNGTIMTPIAALSAVAVGLSRFVIAKRDMIGQHYVNQNLSYLSGVSLGTQSTTTLVDTNSFWSTATGSGGSSGATSFTISAVGSPIHNGWYVSGTGIAAGTRVLSGGGTTTITVDTPLTGTVSGTIVFSAWATNNIIGRRLRVVSSTGINQELAITGVAPTTGTLTTGTAVASGSGSSTYMILPTVVPGVGSHLRWQSDSSTSSNQGRNVFRFRGGGAVGLDRIDLTTDLFHFMTITPNFEALTTGSHYAYDGKDRIYIQRDATNRIYYFDLTNNTIYGAGFVPYAAGTAVTGNRMEIFKTIDGLKYLLFNRHGSSETFRQLIFF